MLQQSQKVTVDNRAMEALSREFIKQKVRKYQHQMPKLSQWAIYQKIGREWQSLTQNQKIAMYNHFVHNGFISRPQPIKIEQIQPKTVQIVKQEQRPNTQQGASLDIDKQISQKQIQKVVSEQRKEVTTKKTEKKKKKKRRQIKIEEIEESVNQQQVISAQQEIQQFTSIQIGKRLSERLKNIDENNQISRKFYQQVFESLKKQYNQINSNITSEYPILEVKKQSTNIQSKQIIEEVKLPLSLDMIAQQPREQQSQSQLSAEQAFMSKRKGQGKVQEIPNTNQPLKPKKTVKQTPKPKKTVNQPPKPKLAVNQPPKPKLAVNQPPKPKLAVNQPPKPKLAVNQPPKPKLTVRLKPQNSQDSDKTQKQQILKIKLEQTYSPPKKTNDYLQFYKYGYKRLQIDCSYLQGNEITHILRTIWQRQKASKRIAAKNRLTPLKTIEKSLAEKEIELSTALAKKIGKMNFIRQKQKESYTKEQAEHLWASQPIQSKFRWIYPQNQYADYIRPIPMERLRGIIRYKSRESNDSRFYELNWDIFDERQSQQPLEKRFQEDVKGIKEEEA